MASLDTLAIERKLDRIRSLGREELRLGWRGLNDRSKEIVMADPEKLPRRTAKRVRCAIYTRKSSDEGLEQAFNSLDAQREACAAFILSQKHEGWTVLPTQYEDGGYSGGTMERPALKRLLSDIEAVQIDVILVYNVDRFTRSLSDFAKLLEVVD